MTTLARRVRLVAPFALAAVPVVSAVVRAVSSGWLPMGDNAYFAIRAGDVLGPHHPLVGAWSSGSTVVGVDVNNLGPLQLDLLAVPVQALGAGPGTAIGVGGLNLVAVLAVVAAGRARAGQLGAWVTALGVTALAWSMGSELLIEPRQHHALVLPFAAVLAGVWCLVARDRRALPWTVLGASLLVQTHLSYVVPLVVLAMASAVATVVMWRDADRSERHGLRRTLLLTVAAATLAWLQPLIDQVAGDQNISAVVEAGQADQASMGVVDGGRALATVAGPPDAWLRPAFLELDPADGLVAGGIAAATLTVTVAVVAATALHARRRGDPALLAGAVTVAVALAAGWAGAASTPIGGPFGAVSGNVRFLWPVAVATWTLALAALVSLLRGRARQWAPALLAAATGVVAVAGVPLSYQSPAPEADAPLRPAARALLDGLGVLEGGGPFLVDRSGLFFGEPYSYVLLLGLQERGIDFALPAATDLSRFGDGRRPDGTEVGTLRLRTGPSAGEPPAGTELILLVTALSDDEAQRLAALEEADADGGLGADDEARYAELRSLRELGTVGLWLGPVERDDPTGSRRAVWPVRGAWG